MGAAACVPETPNYALLADCIVLIAVVLQEEQPTADASQAFQNLFLGEGLPLLTSVSEQLSQAGPVVLVDMIQVVGDAA